jgi:SecD/SecF fusion protein
MNKNLVWKNIFIIVLVIVSAWTLYPLNKTLKPGLDLAGGTSLVYEIDTYGLKPDEKKGLSQRMITVLRRRIDPANIQNLVWRPQGNTRFEIQMPLASVQARITRQNYEDTLGNLLAENINTAQILRSLAKPPQQRTQDFEKIAQNSPHKLQVLTDLAKAYDQYIESRNIADDLNAKVKSIEDKISATKLDLEQVKQSVGTWTKLDQQKLTISLKNFPGSDNNLNLLTEYVNAYAKWAQSVEQLLEPENGKKDIYKNARNALEKLNLTREQITLILEMPAGSLKRNQAIEQLKTEFPERVESIKKTIVAFDEYYPYRGGLDDPRDLQRMLKGVGILEFRILPTINRTELTANEITSYRDNLKTKGPKFASTNEYVWCLIENSKEWKSSEAVVEQFGDKPYVLTSNRKNETMLHNADGKMWRLKKAAPTQDNQGRRAISFNLDEVAGKIFANLTGQNMGRPLCILLDGIAISAPTIQAKIYTSGIITGMFSQTEVSDMVNKLNAGSLPARLVEQPISVKTIGPSIGAENRDQAIKAGIIGLIIVMAFMIVYYTLAGAIADLALLLNLLFILAIMAMIKSTFTLPGIAGLVLTIGMSVDANILIYERVREEQQKGCSLAIAIKNGYQRAFTTIFDSNLTTIITAAILFWVASEEIKGFALILMIGLFANLFTALTVTRLNFDTLLAKKMIKSHLRMLHLFGGINIDWMKLRPVFLTISSIFVIGGLIVFFTRNDVKNNKYDIEFTGGTSVQINLKDNVTLTRQQVQDKIHKIGEDLKKPALAAANVYSVGKSDKQYEITTTETNKAITTITFNQPRKTIKEVTSIIPEELTNPIVTQDTQNPAVFTITTSQTNTFLVKDVLTKIFTDAVISEPKVEEVVNNAILKAFAGELAIMENLQPAIADINKITEKTISSYPELAEFLGGIKITCNLAKPATARELNLRLNDLRFKLDMKNLEWYSCKILDSELNPLQPEQTVNSFVYISVEPEAGIRQLTEDEWTKFVENEKTKVTAAAEMQTSLPRVTQINPSIGAEAITRALLAIILSFIAMAIYIWARFGNFRYGIAAILSLVHDVCTTLGAVSICTYIAPTSIGKMLLIGDFKIDLAIVAAFLTLVGYSVNDTIVVFDRIRENRRKSQLTPQTITNSINQTLSRTILTSFATFLVVIVMYIFGGASLRGFNFTMAFGIITGTYSSIAIAAPILLIGLKKEKK